MLVMGLVLGPSLVLLKPHLLGRYSKYPKECEIIPKAQPEGLSHIPEGVCRMPAVGVV